MKTKILKMLALDALALVFLALVVAFAVWLGGCGGPLPSGAADAAPVPVDAGVDASDAGDAGGCRWVTDGVETVLFCPDDGGGS